jgi:acetyl-CoA C-acetyltransferase
VSNRDALHGSPAIRAAGRTALALAHTDAHGLAHVDLYSCFPSAVQIAAGELGLSLERDLTVTGGMSFAGGPWNNYVLHAIASMVDRLRGDPGTLGLCSGNGGFVTKHAFGIYGTEPRDGGFHHEQPQAEVDQAPTRDVVGDHEGSVTLEGVTVMHDRDGAPEVGFAAALLDDGRRTWASTRDRDLLDTMEHEELVGRPAAVSAGTFHLS